MIPSMQTYFNQALFSEEKHARFLKELNEACGCPIEFRVAEMPIFVSESMRLSLEKSAIEILLSCVQHVKNTASDSLMPKEFMVPNEAEKPLFSVIDFAIALDDNGHQIPKVVELQGFPSLFGYQLRFGQTMKHVYDLHDFTPFFGNFSESSYSEILTKSLIGEHDPDETCLLEFRPDSQKTKPDFSVIEQLTGMKTTDIESVKKEGNALFHLRNGKWIRIRRIFNRAIADELVDNSAKMPFDWRDDIDVEWAGHPNWYFKISKNILPRIQHHSIPKSMILSEISQIPDSLEPFVLKPLFSFAGKGVIISPSHSDIDAIPNKYRSEYILQEKIRYDECVETPFGANKVEIRVMLIWPDGLNAPLPVMSLARTGRGPMMGVRYNNIPWTGSTGCLFG